jgi:hypothetical protein
MHTQYLKIEEDVEFLKVSSAMQMPGNSLELNIGKLETVPQFHLGSNIDKDCFIVFYNPCSTILLT